VIIAVEGAGQRLPDLRAAPGSLQVAWLVDTREPTA
jgi:hypothetical protein